MPWRVRFRRRVTCETRPREDDDDGGQITRQQGIRHIDLTTQQATEQTQHGTERGRQELLVDGWNVTDDDTVGRSCTRSHQTTFWLADEEGDTGCACACAAHMHQGLREGRGHTVTGTTVNSDPVESGTHALCYSLPLPCMWTCQPIGEKGRTWFASSGWSS